MTVQPPPSTPSNETKAEKKEKSSKTASPRKTPAPAKRTQNQLKMDKINKGTAPITTYFKKANKQKSDEKQDQNDYQMKEQNESIQS